MKSVVTQKFDDLICAKFLMKVESPGFIQFFRVPEPISHHFDNQHRNMVRTPPFLIVELRRLSPEV